MPGRNFRLNRLDPSTILLKGHGGIPLVLSTVAYATMRNIVFTIPEPIFDTTGIERHFCEKVVIIASNDQCLS